MHHPASDVPHRDPLPLVDGLRACAALLVLATHVAYQTGEVSRGVFGAVLGRFDLGVALFFVISGFVLYRPWSVAARTGREGPRLRTYLRRRSARILPAYWVVLLLVVLTTARGASAGDVLSNIGLAQVYSDSLLPGYTQTWSLCTEIAFYAVLPPLAGTLVGRGGSTYRWQRETSVLVALAVLAWVWTAVAATGSITPWAGTWLTGHLDWFAVGMLLASAWAHRAVHPTGRVAALLDDVGGHPWGLLALGAGLFWLATTPLAGPLTLDVSTPTAAVVKEVLYGAISGLVVLAAIAGPQTSGPFAAVLGHPVAQDLGRISYGLFLVHLVAIEAALRLLGREAFAGFFWPVLVVTVVLSVAGATASWWLVERPALRWAHRPARATMPAGDAARSPR